MHLSEGILPLKQVIMTSIIAIPFVANGYKKYQEITLHLAKKRSLF